MSSFKDDELTDAETLLATIKHIEVTTQQLAALKDEDGFMVLSVELLKEAASLVALVAGVLPPGSKKWSRDQAIIGGNFVRLFKLLSAHLDQVCQKRQETVAIISRLMFECVVDIKFLIKNASPELFTSYIKYSLRHERKLRDVILENIKDRGGSKLHIEKRMLTSIERAAKRSGMQIDDISPSHPRNWGDKNISERTKDVGLEVTYLGLYGGGSRSIHGGWMDLLHHHLEYEESGFAPNFTWGRPRPQQLLPISQLILETTREFLMYIGVSASDPIIHRIDDVFGNIRITDEAHEAFLSSGTVPSL